jgi:hypothetical protein
MKISTQNNEEPEILFRADPETQNFFSRSHFVSE